MENKAKKDLFSRSWIRADPIVHEFLVFLNLYLEFVEAREFLILTDFEEWSYGYLLIVDIIREVEKMCLEELIYFEKYSDAKIWLSSDDAWEPICACIEAWFGFSCMDIRCRESYSSTECFAMDDDAMKIWIVHISSYFGFFVSMRWSRLLPCLLRIIYWTRYLHSESEGVRAWVLGELRRW